MLRRDSVVKERHVMMRQIEQDHELSGCKTMSERTEECESRLCDWVCMNVYWSPASTNSDTLFMLAR